MNTNILIHVGMHKCASTTLQRGFFANLPNVNYIGTTSKKNSFKRTIRKITHWENYYYQQKKDSIIKELKASIDPELPILLSSEGIGGGLTPFAYVVDRETIAKRLQEIFPNASILLIIRNQYTLFQSAYPQILFYHIMDHKKTSFKDWMDFQIELHFNNVESVFHFADYEMLLSIYQNYFEKVHIVLFEEMVKDIKACAQNVISPMIGINGEENIKYFNFKKRNKRHSNLDIKLQDFQFAFKKNNKLKIQLIEKIVMFLSWRSYDLIGNLAKNHFNIDVDYREEQKKIINEIFRKGNSSVAKIIHTDLAAYGYPV